MTLFDDQWEKQIPRAKGALRCNLLLEERRIDEETFLRWESRLMEAMMDLTTTRLGYSTKLESIQTPSLAKSQYLPIHPIKSPCTPHFCSPPCPRGSSNHSPTSNETGGTVHEEPSCRRFTDVSPFHQQ